MRPLVSFLVLSVLAMGCAREEANPLKRTQIPDLGRAIGTGASLPDLAHPLVSEVSGPSHHQDACTWIELVQLQKSESDTFTVYRRWSSDGLAIDLSQSPFTQYVLGEKFSYDDPDTFFEKARAEYESGSLGTASWSALQAAYHTRFISGWAFRKLQLKGTNDKLNSLFPGVFGEEGEKDGALFLNLARKLVPETEYFGGYSRMIMTARTPLFESRTWARYPQDVRSSLHAMVHSIYDETSNHARLCGFVLLQRMGSQLLTLKGIEGVELQYDLPFPRVQKLADDRHDFSGMTHEGIFGTPLTPDEIQAYDPSTAALDVAEALPRGEVMPTENSLVRTLALLEALVYYYGATIPTAPWIETDDDYFLGDIEDPTSSALAPDDLHRLALGLLSMAFKNIGAFYVQKVDAHGVATTVEEDVAGAVLLSDPNEPSDTTLALNEVLSLTRSAVYLYEFLLSLLSIHPDTLETRNSAYDEVTQAMLLGEKAMPLDRIYQLLGRQGADNVLLTQLDQLWAPLALLLSRFKSDFQCRTQLEWNLETGRATLSQPCDPLEKLALADGLEILAIRTQSEALFLESQRLRAR